MLKGRYYPRGDFMMATKGARASWGWSSLLEGRKLLERNLCWLVGDGSNINVWSDAWIPSMTGYRLSERELENGIDQLRVSSLIEDGKWNLRGLERSMSSEERCAIERIHVPQSGKKDKRIWGVAKNGEYSVKKGYYVALGNYNGYPRVSNRPSTSYQVPTDLWGDIWKLKVPEKIKHFVWRMCNGSLPTKEALYKRRCAKDLTCPCCLEEAESVEHMVLFCGWADLVWFSSSLGVRWSRYQFRRIDEWWHRILKDSLFDERNKSLIAFLCWYIWKDKCCKVFQELVLNPMDTMMRGQMAAEEYWNCNIERKEEIMEMKVQPETEQHWRFPGRSQVKVNCDGAFNSEGKVAGIGVIIRDEEGSVVNGCTERIVTDSALLAEVKAIKTAMDFAERQNCRNCCIESDCEVAVKAIMSRKANIDWQCSMILEDLIERKDLWPELKLKFVRRECNKAADWLAKAALRRMCSLNWVILPPSPLACILLSDKEKGRTGVG